MRLWPRCGSLELLHGSATHEGHPRRERVPLQPPAEYPPPHGGWVDFAERGRFGDRDEVIGTFQ